MRNIVNPANGGPGNNCEPSWLLMSANGLLVFHRPNKVVLVSVPCLPLLALLGPLLQGGRKEICDGGQNFGRICGRGEVFQCDRAGVTGALCPTASPRIAMSEEGVPAMFGGLVLPDLINAFATS